MRVFEGTYRDYFLWLLNQVGYENDPILFEDHMVILTILFQTEFVWSLEDDANRAGDGNYYRKWFGETLIRCNCPDLPFCTVLEMLVALSRRIWNEYIGNPNSPHYESIFFELIHNLFDYVGSEQDSGIILERWLERKYATDGVGSIFPLAYYHGFSANEVPIWEQMQAYITDKNQFFS